MAWRVIDCLGLEGLIRSERGQVVIADERRGENRVPVDDVSVVLVGPRASFSAAAMHRLLSTGAAVLFCDWKGVPEGAAFNWSEHTRVGARQIAQSNLSQPRRKNAWAKLVRAKILGQAWNLDASNRAEADTLQRLAKTVRSGDPGNIEAQSARIYWQALFEGELLRDPGSGIGPNSWLDYGYTVLRGHGIRAVLSAGLAPALGVFHRGRSNPFNLVDDFIEPYRPAIDWEVMRLRSEYVDDDREIRHRLVRAASQCFEADGVGIPSSLTRLAQCFGRYAEGDESFLNCPVWSGPRAEGSDGGEDPER